MKNLICGIAGLVAELGQSIQAINMIEEKNTVAQNKTCAIVSTVAGVIGGIYLGVYLEKHHQEKEAKKKAKEEAKKN